MPSPQTIDINVSKEIKSIFDQNMLDDLKRFLNKRQCLNTANSYLIYLFHLIQSSGILVTSFAAGSENKNLIWIGVALNILASLINVYEKTNNTILRKLMNDIKAIKAGTYVDEGEMVETEKKDEDKESRKDNNEPEEDAREPLLSKPQRTYQSIENGEAQTT